MTADEPVEAGKKAPRKWVEPPDNRGNPCPWYPHITNCPGGQSCCKEAR